MFLSSADLVRLTRRTRYSAQCRALDAMGVRYLRSPSGEPLVSEREVVRRGVRGCALPIPMPTPDAILAARTRAGLTQRAAAELIGAALRSWEDWEGGRRTMQEATWELFLLRTEQHPTHRLTARQRPRIRA